MVPEWGLVAWQGPGLEGNTLADVVILGSQASRLSGSYKEKKEILGIRLTSTEIYMYILKRSRIESTL